MKQDQLAVTVRIDADVHFIGARMFEIGFDNEMLQLSCCMTNLGEELVCTRTRFVTSKCTYRYFFAERLKNEIFCLVDSDIGLDQTEFATSLDELIGFDNQTLQRNDIYHIKELRTYSQEPHSPANDSCRRDPSNRCWHQY